MADVNKMRSVALGALLALASICIAAAPARAESSRAESYRVCLTGGEDNATQCDYTSLEQCRATASGGLGYCVMNPAYASNSYARYDGVGRRIR
jgi:hypothetical protein